MSGHKLFVFTPGFNPCCKPCSELRGCLWHSLLLEGAPVPWELQQVLWILGNAGRALTPVSLPAGHSLCSDPDSSAEVAPEEVETQDLESSDEADKMSKVRRFSLHLTGKAARPEHLSWVCFVFVGDPGWNRPQLWVWHLTCCLLSEICALLPGWIHIFSTW